MATSSEKGIRILDETTFYWVWSTQGPADHGIFYGRYFRHGIVPIPLPGDVAADLESRGFYLTPYVEGEWFDGWEKEENHSFHQRPVFKPQRQSLASVPEAFPPAEPPEKLPAEWVEFFGMYTASGKLKKEYRGS